MLCEDVKSWFVESYIVGEHCPPPPPLISKRTPVRGHFLRARSWALLECSLPLWGSNVDVWGNVVRHSPSHADLALQVMPNWPRERQIHPNVSCWFDKVNCDVPGASMLNWLDGSCWIDHENSPWCAMLNWLDVSCWFDQVNGLGHSLAWSYWFDQVEEGSRSLHDLLW